ncbi:MAG: SDR family NAD(P)-dependent oxidoreductase, partial [Gemmatimonadaceae bacterium]
MPVDRNLQGHHAIITGGSRGIGAAIATALASRGASITVMARSIGDLRSHAAALQHLGSPVQAIECNVSDDASV